ncbi:UNVERIFIED_ORG: hypothetical protein M2438_001982 [Methylobacterium sp. SuP10 SLI 274]|uniref:hypothetical protein n=1 Tax=Methylorubrum extorquens TaxID=408 RepID=UPI00209F57D7|nr:hypothetical protein [Methylorubrum extorquens]MCP1557899.1 hypothetical protein [Methylorubrum extorquens]MDF9863196.1 hypothetical protein [Methylorubrum pseudosasae]MDH6636807.1 hypothetical protein [Methylobacterium sp. SuP10 SLI 274]MDH6665984.1 hypothetical protein [Methylorubrum zatmanii]
MANAVRTTIGGWSGTRRSITGTSNHHTASTPSDPGFSGIAPGIASFDGGLEVASVGHPDVHLLPEGTGSERLLVKGGPANGRGAELGKNLVGREGATLCDEFGYLLHDTVPELFGPEAAALVLDLGKAAQDAESLVPGRLCPNDAEFSV